jgi:hypothetical protein
VKEKGRHGIKLAEDLDRIKLAEDLVGEKLAEDLWGIKLLEDLVGSGDKAGRRFGGDKSGGRFGGFNADGRLGGEVMVKGVGGFGNVVKMRSICWWTGGGRSRPGSIRQRFCWWGWQSCGFKYHSGQ